MHKSLSISISDHHLISFILAYPGLVCFFIDVLVVFCFVSRFLLFFLSRIETIARSPEKQHSWDANVIWNELLREEENKNEKEKKRGLIE